MVRALLFYAFVFSVVPIICDDQLHLVKVVLPLPSFEIGGSTEVQASSIKVISDQPMTHATAIAIDKDNSAIFVARTNGRDLCLIVKLEVDIKQNNSRTVLLARDVSFFYILFLFLLVGVLKGN